MSHIVVRLRSAVSSASQPSIIRCASAARCFSVSASTLEAAAPAAAAATKPPQVAPHFQFYKERAAPLENDPMPNRPPEDDIASCTFYFEALANLHAAAAKSGDAEAIESAAKDIGDRVARMRDPRNLVMILATVTQRRQVATALAAAVEARFTAADGAALRDLDGHYLATLAFSISVQGGSNKAFFESVARRAEALGELEDHDHDNLCAALAKAGVPLPPSVKRVAGAA